jgi:hypothetical protein
VEELPPARPEARQDVLEIRGRRGRTTEHGRIEHAPTRRKQSERSEPAAHLEAEVVDVVVRDTVTRQVDERAEEQRQRPRACERTGGRARGDMERDDHPSQ